MGYYTPKNPRRGCPGCSHETGPQPKASDGFVYLTIAQMVAEDLECLRHNCPVYIEWDIHVARIREQQRIDDNNNNNWSATSGAMSLNPFQVSTELVAPVAYYDEQYYSHQAPTSPHVDLSGEFASIMPVLPQTPPSDKNFHPNGLDSGKVVSDIDTAGSARGLAGSPAKTRTQTGSTGASKRNKFTKTEEAQIMQWRGEGVRWEVMRVRMAERHSARSIESKWRVLAGLRKPKPKPT